MKTSDFTVRAIPIGILCLSGALNASAQTHDPSNECQSRESAATLHRGFLHIYEHDRYRGRCKSLRPRRPPYGTHYHFDLKNDSISSLIIGSDVQAYVCRDQHLGGACHWVSGMIPNLKRHPIGTDKISSIRVIPRNESRSCMPGRNEAALFLGTNYYGSCALAPINYDGQFHLPVRYNVTTQMGLRQDAISSIKVGFDTKVCVCEHTSLDPRGVCELFTSDDPDLNNNRIRNRRISSLQVFARSGGSKTVCELR